MKLSCLILIIAILIVPAFSQTINFDVQKLSKNLDDVAVFKGIRIKSVPVDVKTLRKYLSELPTQDVEKGLKGFDAGLTLVSTKNILGIIRSKDQQGACQLLELEKQFLLWKDQKHQKVIQSKQQQELAIPGHVQTLLIFKKLHFASKDHQVTTFLTVRDNYLLEGHFVDVPYSVEEIKKLIPEIWEALTKEESDKKK